MAKVGEIEITITTHTGAMSNGIQRMLMVMFIMYIRELAFAKRMQDAWENLQGIIDQIESVKLVADMSPEELHSLANQLESELGKEVTSD